MTLEEHIKQSMISCPLTDEQEGLLITGIENYLDELDRVKNCSIPVVCGNCDGYGYTVDENGRRKEHCKECE
jgi:hypothetical protein